MENFNDLLPKVHFEQIQIKNLIPQVGYQRLLSKAHVKKTAENFNPYQINPVKVSRRDGKNYVVNGQHTIEVIALVSGSRETSVWCMVYDNLSYEEEAEIFATQQKYTRSLSSYDIFNAEVEAGNEESITIKSIVEGYNMTLSNNQAPGTICAVATLESIYESYGYSILDTTLGLCIATWQGEKNSLSSCILKAVALLLVAFSGELKESLFKEKLQFTPIMQITRNAKVLQESSNKRGYGYALAMLSIYNNRLSNPLDATKLFTCKKLKKSRYSKVRISAKDDIDYE
jgi:hypothetical protein